MFEIWDGDMLLFAVDSADEADLLSEQGFTVVNANK
jgi:hypothetical protein